MRRQRHETRLPWPITAVFAGLIDVLGRGRWQRGALDAAIDPPPPPDVGTRYQQQRGSVLRRGRVLECLRPVAVTLREVLIDPPCYVKLRLRWRLEPLDGGSLVRLEALYELRGAAPLRRRHWCAQIEAHCERMISALRARLEPREEQPQGAGRSGQITGSSSIEVTNTTSVNGIPTLR